MPLEGTKPFIRTKGEIADVLKEVKIRNYCTSKIFRQSISSMINAHPYEEVAYDLYKLENKGNSVGLG